MKLSHFAIVASTLTAASAYQARSRDECNDFRIVCGFGGHIGADQYTAAADKIPTEGSVGSHAEYFYASGDSGDLIEVISSHGGANPTYEEVKRSADCTATFCDNGDGTVSGYATMCDKHRKVGILQSGNSLGTLIDCVDCNGVFTDHCDEW